MVWLKAGSGLGNTYKKLITASRADVDWQGVILVQNNTIILPGSINSFIFDFEVKKVYPNIIDIPEIKEEVFEIEGRKLLENIFNLLLYVFGKWGTLPGIRVSHSYARIDLLFKQVLKEINSEAYYSDSGIRFTTDGLSVVFEDIVISAINKIKADDRAEAESERLPGESATEEGPDDGPQGLWHDMKWKMAVEGFNKQELDTRQAASARLGSNFYIIPYICPGCSSHLHMSVYPNGKEFAIDTEEGKVYIARVYMCPACSRFYTPRPGKLLSDGDIYILDFDNDAKAAEDYKRLIGRRGRKTSNSNFNMYEAEYIDKVHSGNRSLAKICSRIKELADEELERLLSQMDEGFFTDREIERFMAYIEQELEYRKNAGLDPYTKFRMGLKSGKTGEDGIAGRTGMNRPDYSILDSELKETSGEETSGDSVMDAIVRNYMGGTEDSDSKSPVNNTVQEDNTGSNKEPENSNSNKTARKHQKTQDTQDKQDTQDIQGTQNVQDTKGADGNNKPYSKESKTQAGGSSEEDTQNTEHASEYTENIENSTNENNKDSTGSLNAESPKRSIFIDKEDAIKAIKLCQNKKYPDIQKLAADIENSSLSTVDKEELAGQLKELLEQTGKKELDYLVSRLPQNDSRKRYKKFKEQIQSYKEIDTSKYEEIIDKFIQNAEHAELSAAVRKAGTGGRRSMLELIDNLKNSDFDPGILKEYTDELYSQVREIDTETVRKICPDIAVLDVEDGIRAMQEIEAADILPELKSEMTALIDRKLTRMKTEESLQLVEKLRRTLDKSIEDSSRIHYYDVRKMQEGDNKDDESILIRNAISRYAVLLGRYEYPVMICDSSLFGNGKDGFIVTPDHIFYKGMVKSGKLDVMDIEEISLENSRAGKAIFISKKSGTKLKLPCSLKGKDQKSMALALNDFAAYLKKKPESRSIEYMSQQKHAAICCYRCGHVFKEGSICPKCGSRN